MQTRIRRSLPHQHQNLFFFWRECIDFDKSLSKQEYILKIQELITEHHYFEHLQLFHIEVDQKILGFIGLAYQKIEMFYVHPQFSGLGIGSALLKHALSLGMREVDVLEVHSNLQHFYQKHGFQAIARSQWDAQGIYCPTLHLKLQQTS